ncbi:MAG: hypothetical protein RMK19_08735 [Bacteroidia bacterium]|nr:hypothetical protein [Bacteroidia bacterium]MDW8016080.1 hypothetical protein [Bacteroidia bacterium]
MASSLSFIRGLASLGYLSLRLLIGQGLGRQRLVFCLQIGAIALSSGAALIILVLFQSFRLAITDSLYQYFGTFWIQYYAEEYESRLQPIDRAYLDRLGVRVEPAIHLPIFIEGRDGRSDGIQLIAVEASWWELPLWRSRLAYPISQWNGESGIVLSRRLAQRLGVSVGEKVTLLWLADPPRLRRLPVLSLYEAHLEEVDRQVAFAPLSLAQTLLGWQVSQVQVAHVFMPSSIQQDKSAEEIAEKLPNFYEIVPMEAIFPDIFNWISLIEQNVQLILLIVLGLTIFVVSSGFLVLQFGQRLRYEVLWAIGIHPLHLRTFTLFQAMWSVGLGTAGGLSWASLLLWTQAKWGWFHLDPESYLLPVIPVHLTWKPYIGVIGAGLCLAIGLGLLSYPKRRLLRLLTQAE